MIEKNTSNVITFDRNLTDLVKFLSCLMIALHHYSQWRIVAGTHNPIYQLFSTQGGWLGVAIFFFLSGYGLMKSDMMRHLEPLPFFKKRLVKSYLPAVLVSLLWCCYLVLGGGKSIGIHLLNGILWYFNDEVLWFVRAIVKLYVVFYAYSWLRLKMPKVKFYTLVFAAILAIMWTHAGFVHGSSVLLFFVAVSLAEYDRWWLKVIRKIYPVAIALVTIFVLAFLYRHDAEWIHLLINYFVILSGVVLVAVCNINLPSQPKWIGGASYDIYLVHNKALMLLRPMYAVVPLWMFVGLAFIFTIMFYNLRKIIKL